MEAKIGTSRTHFCIPHVLHEEIPAGTHDVCTPETFFKTDSLSVIVRSVIATHVDYLEAYGGRSL